MDYQDRATIGTPEAVDLSLALAGVGSRAIATAIDYGIQLSLLAAVLFVVAPLAGSGGDAVLIVAAALTGFFVLYVFDVLFEAFRGGRTPGKQVAGLRVVREGGRPVDFRAAAIRNILKILDGPATLYAAGIVSIVVSPRNQRLGDMAAGTLVIRERFASDPKPPPPLPPGYRPAEPAGSALAWDMSAIAPGDVAVVRRFLARRGDLEPEPRGRLADALASRLRPLVAGADPTLGTETFLERLVEKFEQR